MSISNSDPVKEYRTLKSLKPDICLVRYSRKAVNFTNRLCVAWQTFARMLKYILEGKYFGDSNHDEMFESLQEILRSLVGAPVVERLIRGR